MTELEEILPSTFVFRVRWDVLKLCREVMDAAKAHGVDVDEVLLEWVRAERPSDLRRWQAVDRLLRAYDAISARDRVFFVIDDAMPLSDCPATMTRDRRG